MTIHAVIRESEGVYVAECAEVAVVTQGGSLDDTVCNLREALTLFMSDEEPTAVEWAADPRLSIVLETTVCPSPSL